MYNHLDYLRRFIANNEKSFNKKIKLCKKKNINSNRECKRERKQERERKSNYE
jgi:hypothetical protein